MMTTTEQPVRDEKGNRTIPDLSFTTGDKTYYVDVSVVGVFAASNRCRKDGAAITTREKSKHKDYDKQCKLNGGEFISFVVDSHGRLGPDALKIIGILHQAHIAAHTTSRNPRFVDELTNEIVIQLQRGNAMVDLDGMSMVLRNRYGHQYLSGRFGPGFIGVSGVVTHC
jgi:hypothetical protein